MTVHVLEEVGEELRRVGFHGPDWENISIFVLRAVVELAALVNTQIVRELVLLKPAFNFLIRQRKRSCEGRHTSAGSSSAHSPRPPPHLPPPQHTPRRRRAPSHVSSKSVAGTSPAGSSGRCAHEAQAQVPVDYTSPMMAVIVRFIPYKFWTP
jgi:hypothetical protein